MLHFYHFRKLCMNQTIFPPSSLQVCILKKHIPLSDWLPLSISQGFCCRRNETWMFSSNLLCAREPKVSVRGVVLKISPEWLLPVFYFSEGAIHFSSFGCVWGSVTLWPDSPAWTVVSAWPTWSNTDNPMLRLLKSNNTVSCSFPQLFS